MARWWRCLADYNGEAVAYEAAAGAGGASPFVPDKDARLIGLKLFGFSETAASLKEGVLIRLTCALWSPNTMIVAHSGIGLATVPVNPANPIDYPVEQPVKAGVPITIEGLNLVATAVTQRTLVMGLFEG